MKSRIADAFRRAAGQAPATATDHLLHGLHQVAPRFHYAFELVLPQALERALVRDGLRRTVARFPILGCRYLTTPVGARWVGVRKDPVHRLLESAQPLEATAQRTLRAALHRAREAALSQPLDATRGQLLRIHRFQLPTGQQRLLFIGHPMVTDPYGWLRVLEEYFVQMGEVEAGVVDPPAPSPRANRSLTALLLEQPRLTQRSVWDAVRDLVRFRTDLRCLWEGLGADSAVVHRPLRLSPDRLKRLKEEAALAGGSVRDALIGCVARACDATDLGLCKDRDGVDLLRLGLAVDLRRFARRRPGLGNYTSLQLATLELPLPGSLAAVVMQLRPQMERALEQRAALQAITPLTLLGQVPPAVTQRLVTRSLHRAPPMSVVLFDLGRLDRRLPTLDARGVRRITFFPPAAGFLPLSVGICSWRHTLGINTAFAREQLVPEEIARFADRLAHRVRLLSG